MSHILCATYESAVMTISHTACRISELFRACILFFCSSGGPNTDYLLLMHGSKLLRWLGENIFLQPKHGNQKPVEVLYLASYYSQPLKTNGHPENLGKNIIFLHRLGSLVAQQYWLPVD